MVGSRFGLKPPGEVGWLESSLVVGVLKMVLTEPKRFRSSVRGRLIPIDGLKASIVRVPESSGSEEVTAMWSTASKW